MRLFKLTLLAAVATLMLVANGFAYSLPGGLTGYNSMGKSFVWDTWGPKGATPPPDGDFLKFDTNQNVLGFKNVANFGGQLTNLVGGTETSLTSLQSTINFKDFAYASSESGFGLELSWKVGADYYAGIGIYRGVKGPVNGYAVAYWNDLTGKDGILASTMASDVNGSLSFNLTGDLFTGGYKDAGGVWQYFDPINLALYGWSAGVDQKVFGLSGNGAVVNFDGFTSTPEAPAATPIPGAVWLLGSGLVGLVGLRKKMKN